MAEMFLVFGNEECWKCERSSKSFAGTKKKKRTRRDELNKGTAKEVVCEAFLCSSPGRNPRILLVPSATKAPENNVVAPSIRAIVVSAPSTVGRTAAFQKKKTDPQSFF